jgi:hypothetical protein
VTSAADGIRSGLARGLGRGARGLLRNPRLLALLLVALSEALICEWLARALAGHSLGVLGMLATAVAFALGNLAVLANLARLARSVRGGYTLGRLFMVVSIAALVTGPPLAAAFALFGPLAWLGHSVWLLTSGGAAIMTGFGAIGWGYLVGQRRVEIERIDLPVRSWPDSLGGLRVAQISDLHIGPQLRAPLLREFVARVNAVGADLIAITGDVFDFDPSYVEEGCRELAQLRAPLGVFCVLGNHDVYTGVEAVAAGLARFTSIRVLRDENARLSYGGAQFAIAGVEDHGRNWNERDSTHAALERLAAELPAELPRLLLIHRPSYFAQAARLGFPISLAGHTHGGQIALPGAARHHNVSRLISRWTRGLFRDEVSGALLYVNRGLGVAGPPVRLNCAREISLLRLVPEPRTPSESLAAEPSDFRPVLVG